MRSGLDQYLASSLTTGRRFEVLADPKDADAVITDSLGEAFQAKMKELYPPPEPPKEKATDKDKSGDKDKDKDADKDKSADSPKTAGARVPQSSFSRAKGTIFVVDPKSMLVLWSIYAPPKNSSATEVDAAAKKVAQAMLEEVSPRKTNKAMGWLTGK